MILNNEYDEKMGCGTVVYVQNPMKRLVSIDQSYCGLNYKKKFFLSLPHVIFRINYQGFRYRIFDENNKSELGKKHIAVSELKYATSDRQLNVAFSTDPEGKRLFRPPFPNVFQSLNCCCPSPTGYFNNLEDLCKSYIAKFWSSEFSYVSGHDYDPRGQYFGQNPEEEIIFQSAICADSTRYLYTDVLADHQKW